MRRVSVVIRVSEPDKPATSVSYDASSGELLVRGHLYPGEWRTINEVIQVLSNRNRDAWHQEVEDKRISKLESQLEKP